MKYLKAVLFPVLAVGCLTPKAAAQGSSNEPLPKNAIVHHHEVFAGYGFLNMADLIFDPWDPYVEGYSERDGRVNSIASAGYKYRFDKVASLGVTYVLAGYSGKAHVYHSSGGEVGRTRQMQHTFAVECDFRYLTRKSITLYSTVGVAVSYLSRVVIPHNPEVYPRIKESRTFPYAQVSLIGVKVGGERLGGWLEFGRGYKGLISAGVYTRF